MIDTQRELCVCNAVTAQEVIDCIRANDIRTLEALLEQQECPVGDKCEFCIEEGFENDGFSLLMVLSLVKQGKIG